MPSFDERSGDLEQLARGRSDLESLADRQSMTHQPDQPNPAAPYLDWLRQQARRTFVDPLRATGFVPGGPNWARGAVTGMQDFSQSGLTGVAPSLRNIMPGAANTIGDLVQSPAARNVFSTANFGGIPFGGILTLQRGPNVFGMDIFKLKDQYGKWIGDSKIRFEPKTKQAYVGWLGTDNGPLSLGLKEIRTLIPEIERHYPGVRQIGAVRVTGARGMALKEDMVINIYKHDDGQWRFTRPTGQEQPATLTPRESTRRGRTRALSLEEIIARRSRESQQ